MLKLKDEFEETLKEFIDFSKYLINPKDLANFELLHLCHSSKRHTFKALFQGSDVFLKQYNIKIGSNFNETEL